MDQNLPETQQPSFNLPEPKPEQATAPSSSEQQGVTYSSEAQAATSLEQSGGPAVSTPDPLGQATPPNDPGASAVPVQGAAAQPSSDSVSTPHIADDADLIEKEWVTKAKKIVAETAQDPHLQSEKLTEVKADYVKKRFNIDIKLAGE